MTRTYRNREQWSQIIEEFYTSHMSIAAFCRSRQLNEGSFYRWRKLLTEQPAPVDEPPLFVDITPPVSQPAPDTPAWDIELALGNGMVLRMRRPC